MLEHLEDLEGTPLMIKLYAPTSDVTYWAEVMSTRPGFRIVRQEGFVYQTISEGVRISVEACKSYAMTDWEISVEENA